ncbi:MFS transporter [Helcobacillus sp. ACRRO]|uniref:MFS transporter n=1 Tax=Helcobacillus sp. ACRRO TaxID=2918202 RepID=UPI001EF5C426|nr:MFS transporter [Helcobacillus sp. ACRRO]
MTETPTRPAGTAAERARRAVAGGIVGNLIDQLHIFVPVVALAPALPTLIGSDRIELAAALVMAATLIGRPVGAAVFGSIADRVSRTATTQIAIGGTALFSLLIALVPAHTTLGAGTLVAIIALRFLLGIAIAGEYSAAIPLAMEWSAPRRRGLNSGLIMAMAPLAQASIAAFTALALQGLGPAAYAQWGWRIIFLLASALSVGMLLFYRRFVVDATGAASSTAAARLRLWDVVAGRWAKPFWQLFVLMSGLWLMTQMTVIVIVGRLSAEGGPGLEADDIALIMLAASLGQAVAMAFAGHASTLLGRRRFLTLWGVGSAVLAPAVWMWAMGTGTLGAALAPVVLLQMVTVPVYGPMGAYISESFSAAVRSRGYGTAYSASIVLPSLTMLYMPLLDRALGPLVAPAVVLGAAGLLVAAAALAGPAARREEEPLS